MHRITRLLGQAVYTLVQVPEVEVASKGMYIVVAILVAIGIHLVATRIAGRLVRLSRFQPHARRPRPERQATIQGLIASAISLIAFLSAGIVSGSQFVAADTLVWVVGLFSAAFGLGARPLISDFLSGVSFIFEDTFAVGEKVEMIMPGSTVEGTIERVNLRTTTVRALTGELYVVPNGEVQVVRNFSRGRFSTVTVTVKVPADQLQKTLAVLEATRNEVAEQLPNLIEPWQILSETGIMEQQTELTLIAKARFGKAAEMRPRLLALVQERLAEAGVLLAE